MGLQNGYHTSPRLEVLRNAIMPLGQLDRPLNASSFQCPKMKFFPQCLNHLLSKGLLPTRIVLGAGRVERCVCRLVRHDPEDIGDIKGC